MKNFVVALDGPAGSGKSSISKMVADRLGFVHIDTGAMYRAVTLEALRRNIDLEKEEDYTFLDQTTILYQDNTIYLNGENVNDAIRSKEVTAAVSTACKFKTVRDRMVDYQRKSASTGKILMDGRDIGTVVLPNADVKIFLTASPEVRAKRRYDELVAKGQEVLYEDVLNDILIRDKKDSSREIAPLKKADDAILLDSSNLSKEEVCDAIATIINERLEKMEDFKMEDLTLPKELKVKDVVEGTVVQVEDKTIYLDIHNFTEGKMHLEHYSKDALESFEGVVHVGDVIRCEVAKITDDSIYLSRLNQLQAEAFQQVVAAKENNEPIQVSVRKEIPHKGYQVDYMGNTLFLPMSQAPHHKLKNHDLLTVRVLEVNLKQKSAIVSRRVIEQEEYALAKEKEYEAISEGDILKGTVVKIENFGAFIRFQYNQGLLRINQVAHTFTNDIHTLLKEGDEIEVKVISKQNNKLLLSRKALLSTPYEAYVQSVKVGQTVKGRISNKLPFGLLIELAPSVKGLLHSSEYSHNPNDNYNDYVKIGDEVEVAILALDPEKEKISLSRKALMDNPWKRVHAKVGDVVDGVVSEITDSGLIIDTLGVEGFVPASETLTESQNGHFKDYFDVSDPVQAEIMEIKPEEWRLKLSIRRLKEKQERQSYEKYLKNEEVTVTIGDRFKDILK